MDFAWNSLTSGIETFKSALCSAEVWSVRENWMSSERTTGKIKMWGDAFTPMTNRLTSLDKWRLKVN